MMIIMINEESENDHAMHCRNYDGPEGYQSEISAQSAQEAKFQRKTIGERYTSSN